MLFPHISRNTHSPIFQYRYIKYPIDPVTINADSIILLMIYSLM